MSSVERWVVASFSAETARGTITNETTGANVDFDVEAWLPCEPGTAVVLAESERRRSLLHPRVGEAVDVTWKDASRTGKPVAIARRTPITAVLPPLTFAEWVWRMGQH